MLPSLSLFPKGNTVYQGREAFENNILDELGFLSMLDLLSLDNITGTSSCQALSHTLQCCPCLAGRCELQKQPAVLQSTPSSPPPKLPGEIRGLLPVHSFDVPLCSRVTLSCSLLIKWIFCPAIMHRERKKKQEKKKKHKKPNK